MRKFQTQMDLREAALRASLAFDRWQEADGWDNPEWHAVFAAMVDLDKCLSRGNPNNGYIPKVGERVRIVGACHPRAFGKVVEVTAVREEDGEWWMETKHYDPMFPGEFLYGGGVLGGVEPAPGCEIDTY